MAARPLLLLLALALVASAAAAPAAEPAPAEGGSSTPDSGILGGLSVLYNSLAQCEHTSDMGGCLKLKAIRSLERALASDTLELAAGVSLTRAGPSEGARALEAVQPLEERALPEGGAAREQALDALLAERAQLLFQSRSLSFSLPRALSRLLEGGDEGQGGDEAARKSKKNGGILILGLLWKVWITIMAYKGVALLAGKALMTATVALVLAGILALSKLLHHHDKGHTTVEIVRHPHITHSYSHSGSHEHMEEAAHGHGWGRALEEEQRRRRERAQRGEADLGATETGYVQMSDAQQMAYRAHYQRQLQAQQQAQAQAQAQAEAQYQAQQTQQGEAVSVPL